MGTTGRLHELTVRVDTSVPNRPAVRLLVDGTEVLASRENDTPNDPSDLLDTGALLPADPPVRVAFYGCGCGEFGCGNVAGLVRRVGDVVEWTDFCSVTGVYHSALPGEAGPDPLAEADYDLPVHRHDLPTLRFDAEAYVATVHAATADRSWESRARAVTRLVAELRPGTVLWTEPDGDRLIVPSDDGRLTVPEGPAEEVARRLVGLLEDGATLSSVATRGSWR